MSAIFTSPITVEKAGQKLKLVYMQFNSDSSVYLMFPRKNKYRITKESHSFDLKAGENKVELAPSSFSTTSTNPYISFHPGKKSTHVNLQPKGEYIKDCPIVEMSDEIDASAFPLCNITLSDSGFLDLYKSKGEHAHELSFREKADPDKYLNLEFWVHTNKRVLLLEDLPFAEERIKANNIIGLTTLNDDRLKEYSVSIFATELERDDKDILQGISLVLWRKGSPSAFLIEPNFS